MAATGWIGFVVVVLGLAAFVHQLFRIWTGDATPRSLVPEGFQDLALVALGSVSLFRPDPAVRTALVVCAVASLVGWAATHRWRRASPESAD